MMRKYMQGVTLMELLIVVLIVSILAAIAYPNYRSYVERSKRTEAKAALLQIATNQERHYLNSNVYTTDMTRLGFAQSPFTTDSGAYVVTVTAADANAFNAQAVYQLGGDEAGRCLTFTINAVGEKTSAPRADCWTNTR
jgi:type IV pilus assembly protein PilE